MDPSDEALADDWTLSSRDLVAVRRCRGEALRTHFAMQLCVARRHHRFLGDPRAVPIRIVNHLCRQLEQPPVLFVEPVRPETDREHQRRIRDHLGLERFDAALEDNLLGWLIERAVAGEAPGDLIASAEAYLRQRRRLLPGRSRLERLATRAAAQAEAQSLARIEAQLPNAFLEAVDELVAVGPDEQRSMLARLKQYPPEPRPPIIRDYVARFEYLDSIGVSEIDIEEVRREALVDLAELGRRYDADDLKRFSRAKRRVLLACLLVEERRTILDHLVAMHAKYLESLARRARIALERHQREVRSSWAGSLDTILSAVEMLLDTNRPPGTIREQVLLAHPEDEIRESADRCRAYRNLDKHGYVDELRARYDGLATYFGAFLALPFEGTTGTDDLLRSIEIARERYAEGAPDLPAEAPLSILPKTWRSRSIRDDGRIDRSTWEIALAFAMRDALRSGDLYLAGSRDHVSFWNLVLSAHEWSDQRPERYSELRLSPEADQAVASLRAELDHAAVDFHAGLPQNAFAAVASGSLKLRRRDALEIPESVQALRGAIEAHLPRVRIEQLLLDVDSWCHFTDAFRPLPGYRTRTPPPTTSLLATLVAHGTNLGVVQMAECTDAVSLAELQHVSRWYLRPETLSAANRALVDYHHRLSLSSVWGSGTASSSDGQRFGIRASSLLASVYPRYFGYYDRALSVYTHLSDQHSVFAERAISCTPREAIYVLDGLLENDTLLEPRVHHTDTHGQTEQLFGLMYLLGFSFMPRFRDLKDQSLYKIDRDTSYGDLDGLFRGTVDVGLIGEQWDNLVRVAVSLRDRTAPAHLVVQRLAASSPSDRLAKALTALGRVVKTVYILRYLHDPETRARVQLQLNRGESRHELAQRLFFWDQGIFRTGDYAEIMNKVSALSVLSNAVLVWNTVRMSEIVEQLRARGEDVREEDLARISPLLHAHVIPNGTYDFSPRARRSA